MTQTNTAKLWQRVALLSLSLLLLFSLVGCFSMTDTEALWKDAKYTEDTSFGEGAKTVTVTVTAGEKSIVFTLKTDSDMLGDALMEHGLLEGDMGDFGLYMKRVNGILADYDVDKTYWALYIGEDYALTGVDTTPVTDGGVYSLVRSK